VVRVVSGVVLSVLCICHILRVLARLLSEPLSSLFCFPAKFGAPSTQPTEFRYKVSSSLIVWMGYLGQMGNYSLKLSRFISLYACVMKGLLGFTALWDWATLCVFFIIWAAGMGSRYERQQATYGSGIPSNTDSLVSQGFVNIGFCL